MTELIVDLGGDVNFKTWFEIGTCGFGVGRGMPDSSAIKIAQELKKMKFSKDRKLKPDHIDVLSQLLRKQVKIFCLYNSLTNIHVTKYKSDIHFSLFHHSIAGHLQGNVKFAREY